MEFTEKKDSLIKESIATKDKINLVLRVNEIKERQLNNTLFTRTSYRSFESCNYYKIKI